MNIWDLKEGDLLSGGTVSLVRWPFVTFITEHPPGAITCADLYKLGLEVYIQPLTGYWKGYVTTYKYFKEGDK